MSGGNRSITIPSCRRFPVIDPASGAGKTSYQEPGKSGVTVADGKRPKYGHRRPAQCHRKAPKSMKQLRIEDCANKTWPWSGKPVSADSLTIYQGKVVGFCNPGCRDKFEQATKHFDAAS